MKVKIYYRIEKDGTSYIEEFAPSVLDLILNSEVYKKISITKIEMTPENYKLLKEFQGF